jgi:hypothetical protein
MQPFSLDYWRYGGLVTKSWLKSIWEKMQALHLRIEIGNIDLEPPREGDAWFMEELFWMQYDKDELTRLNRVCLHQQILFLSDILDARGTAINRKYLQWCLRSKRWLNITFLLEDPPEKDFRLWEQALFRLGAGWQGQGRMREFKCPGHKIRHWLFDAETEML